MNKYILAIDAGTTSSRAIIFDQNGATIGLLNMNSLNTFPRKVGWNMIPLRFGTPN